MIYITLTEAEEYFANRLNAGEWEKASEKDKQKALATATSKIDGMRFKGKKLDKSQPREWPRDIYDGIPQRVKWATAEEALSLLQADPSVAKGVVSVRIGDAGESYDPITVRRNAKLCPLARSLLDPFTVKVVPFK